MKSLPIDLDHFSALQDLIDARHCLPQDSYQRCALYYLLTARAGGLAHHTAENLVITCRHPHKSHSVVIFPELGRHHHFALTRKIIEAGPGVDCHFELGRFSKDEYDGLCRAMGWRRDVGDQLFMDSTMDWVFPVHLLSTRRVADCHGHAFWKIRNKVRRARASVGIVMRLCDTDPAAALQSVYKLWQKGFHQSQLDSAAQISDYYGCLVQFIDRNKTDIDGLIFHDQLGQAIGMSAWRRLPGAIANLYLNICALDQTGMSDFQIVAACDACRQDGILFLNMGGSEEKSLDDFKRKYVPVRSLHLFSAETQGVSPAAAAVPRPSIVLAMSGLQQPAVV